MAGVQCRPLLVFIIGTGYWTLVSRPEGLELEGEMENRGRREKLPRSKTGASITGIGVI